MVRNGSKAGSCGIPSRLTEESFIEYVPGDLVVAKVVGYSPWPGMIEVSPVESDITQHFKRKKRDTTEYHVTYFGVKAMRSWVEVANIQRLTSECLNEKRKIKSLIPAIKEAEEALKLSPEDRLKVYGFSKRCEAKEAKRVESIDTIQQEKKRKKKVNGNLHAEVSVPRKRKVKEELGVNDEDSKTNEFVLRGTRRCSREIASTAETPKREMRSSKKLKVTLDNNNKKKSGTAHTVSSSSEVMVNGHETIIKEGLSIDLETNPGPSLARENVSLSKDTDPLTICKDANEADNGRLSLEKIVPSASEETGLSTVDKAVYRCENDPLSSEASAPLATDETGLWIVDKAANGCENEPVSSEQSTPLAAEEMDLPIVNGVEHDQLSDEDDLDIEENSEDTELVSQADGEIPPDSNKESSFTQSEGVYFRYLKSAYYPHALNSESFPCGKILCSSPDDAEKEDSKHLTDDEDSSDESKNNVDPNLNEENSEQVYTNLTSENPSNSEAEYFGSDNEINHSCMYPHESFILGNS